MRGLVQRVTRASVTIGGEVVGQIGPGVCLLVGVTHEDDEVTAAKLARKVWNLRILADGDGAMNRSLADRADGAEGTGGRAEVLVVSQFTLYGDARKGRRPSWVAAARPEQAEPLVEAVVGALRDLGAIVATGRFGADMAVALVNDGPVTLLLES